MPEEACVHIAEIGELKLPVKHVCEECVKIKVKWVHLSTCQSCGVTLCCNDSPLKHMAQHNNASGHPVIISAEPGERWMWCYKDELFIKY